MRITLRKATYLRLRGIQREHNLKSVLVAIDMVVEAAAKSLQEDPLKSDRITTIEERKEQEKRAKADARAAKAKRKADAAKAGA